MDKNAISIQEKYYTETAHQYDDLHVSESCLKGHRMAVSFLVAMIELYKIQSILDVGAGTGRTMVALKAKFPTLKIKGIEPIDALREEAYKKGLSKEDLLKGDGYKINFQDNSFDLVCAFGVLHHVQKPNFVIQEMLRLSKISIFISDANNFGQGSFSSRAVKNILRKLHLWNWYLYIRTKGKMYEISKGDGLYYSYSIFNNYKQIAKKCEPIHLLNTGSSGINFMNTASSVALFAVKNKN